MPPVKKLLFDACQREGPNAGNGELSGAGEITAENGGILPATVAPLKVRLLPLLLVPLAAAFQSHITVQYHGIGQSSQRGIRVKSAAGEGERAAAQGTGRGSAVGADDDIAARQGRAARPIAGAARGDQGARARLGEAGAGPGPGAGKGGQAAAAVVKCVGAGQGAGPRKSNVVDAPDRQRAVVHGQSIAQIHGGAGLEGACRNTERLVPSEVFVPTLRMPPAR